MVRGKRRRSGRRKRGGEEEERGGGGREGGRRKRGREEEEREGGGRERKASEVDSKPVYWKGNSIRPGRGEGEYVGRREREGKGGKRQEQLLHTSKPV